MDSRHESKTSRKKGALRRFMRMKAKQKLGMGGRVLSHLAEISKLKEEIALLTSYSTDVIYRLRYDTMRYDYVSPSVVRLLGYQPEELKRISFRSLIVETRMVKEMMLPISDFGDLEKARAERDVQKWEADYLIKTKDGKKIWVSDISYPWFDETGNIIGSVGSLRDIGDRVAAEERSAAMRETMERMDWLTGMANRRLFFERLENESKRSKRAGHDLGVLLIDIDRLKQVNDSYGQAMGDRVIREVGRVIQSCLRETDLAARIGGEEFGVLLPDTPSEGSYWVAERIRRKVAQMNFSEEPGRVVGCTVSVVVSESDKTEPMGAVELYKTADSRLFIAKHLGKNQVSMDEIVGSVH